MAADPVPRAAVLLGAFGEPVSTGSWGNGRRAQLLEEGARVGGGREGRHEPDGPLIRGANRLRSRRVGAAAGLQPGLRAASNSRV